MNTPKELPWTCTSPVIANFYMEAFKEKVLKMATHKPTCWFRHTDDTFVIQPHGRENLDGLMLHLNSIHTNIQLTMKTDRDGTLLSLIKMFIGDLTAPWDAYTAS
jgi:hypothetical protein